MSDSIIAPPPDDWGSWEENRRQKHLVGLSVSAEERLAWLEEMLELAFARGALPKPRDAWGQPIRRSR